MEARAASAPSQEQVHSLARPDPSICISKNGSTTESSPWEMRSPPNATEMRTQSQLSELSTPPWRLWSSFSAAGTLLCTDAHLQGPMPVGTDAHGALLQLRTWVPHDPLLNQTLHTTPRTHPELFRAEKPIQQLPGETGGQTRKCGFGNNYPRNVVKWAMSLLGWRYQWAKGGTERSTSQIIPKTRGTTETFSSSILVLCFNHIQLLLFKL